MKQCSKCGGEFPATEFYKGFNACKPCIRARVRANRAEKVDYYREFDRRRAFEPERVKARRAYQIVSQCNQKPGRTKGFVLRNPEKRAAHVLVGNALRAGKIKRLICEVCGDPKSQAHHDDYSRPMDVTWLCATCHGQQHRYLNEMERRKYAP